MKKLLLAIIPIIANAAEPTGKEWEDHTLLNFGKEAPRSAFASFATVEEAKAIRPELCKRRLCLDSERDWRFNWCYKPEERPIGFYRPDYDVSKWPIVKVPCSWQAMGINAERKPYDRPYYTNVHWPFVAKFPANSNCWPRVRGHQLPEGYTLRSDENPVGSYRRDFTIPADWAGDEIYLEFGAVDSFFYLWVNGEYVGFSKSSRDPACFNVTKLVKPGRNTVALEVYRFSDGSYLEAQDMFLLSGITRSVWAYHVPKTHLRDVFFTTSPVRKGDYAGDWKLNLQTELVGGAAEVKPHVFDADDREVTTGNLVFKSPKLWSAECPNLYTLVLEVVAGGKTLEAVGFQLGFREVEIRDAADQKDRTFLLNGQPIKMRGANRHESSPMYGHYTPDELIELDVKQLKQANCNHVRNSHYPQPDYFYYLCNKYGIYVMDEANVESHGFFYGKESISHVKSWEPAHVQRVMNMVERNKCHPSIVIWSLGNEAGPGDNFKSCTAAIKARDLSRPVQYERNNWLTDMGSRQYPQVQWVWDCANGKDGMSHEPKEKPLRYPFHINEYAHNMGNAMGDLKEYQDAIESTTRICGAAIWDWVDQGIWHVTSNGVKVLAYGGDFGDYPTAGPFMMNGCVLSDRSLEPGYWEIKHVFQPIVATKGDDGRSIKITNRHYFRDLAAYDLVITHLIEGKTVFSSVQTLELAPRKQHVIAIADPTGSYRVEFRQKCAEGFWPQGWIIADDQIDFTEPNVAETTAPKGHLDFGFSKTTGELESLKAENGSELLKEPLSLDVWRAPVQNEPQQKKNWAAQGFAAPQKRLVAFDDRMTADGSRLVKTSIDYSVTGTTFRVDSEWRIRGGVAKVKCSFNATGSKCEPARIGLRTVFSTPKMNVEWLGRGPWENYSDRKSGAFVGLWKLPSSDFFVPYDVPQDCGNREDTYRVTLDAVTFATTAKPFAFEVNPYAPETLVKYAHPAELPRSNETFFGIYAKSRGLGGNSCGPLPLAKDIVGMGPYTLEFTITAKSEIVLAERGKTSDFTIVLPVDASPSQRQAAKELAEGLERTTDIKKLPLVTADSFRGGRAIYLGRDPGDTKELGTDGFRLKVKDGDIYVVGSAQRGTLYGVYELLERFAGIGWYEWNCTHYPKLQKVSVPEDLDLTEIPWLLMRDPCGYDAIQSPAFAAHLRFNGAGNGHPHAPKADEKLGGVSYRFPKGNSAAHTLLSLVPPKKYFKTHPEYYSEINGVRRDHFTQVCLTNPDVLRIATESVMKLLAAEPDVEFVGVSNEDWYFNCQCAACRASDEHEGSCSGTLINFVNKIAEAVEKKYPRVYVQTLAYMHTRKAPKFARPRHNVVPTLCPIECDFGHPMKTSQLEVNRRFRQDMEDWSAITDKLYIWDYVTDFGFFAHVLPNLHVLQSNMQYFRDHHTHFMYSDGGAYTSEFGALKTYLIGKWMWNPDLPADELIDRYLQGAYGPAAPYLKEYLKITEAVGENNPQHFFGCFSHGHPTFFTPEFTAQARELWAKARAAIGNDAAMLKRFDRLSFSPLSMRLDATAEKLKYVWVTRHPERFEVAKGAQDDLAEAERIIAGMKADTGKPVLFGFPTKSKEATIYGGWQRIKTFKRPSQGNDRAIVGVKDLTIFHEDWGKIVDDPSAMGGKAYLSYNTQDQLTLLLNFAHVAYDPGVRYTVRVRVKAKLATDAKSTSEVFRATLGDAKFSVTAGEIADNEWHWYSFAPRELTDQLEFQFCPGSFAKGGGRATTEELLVDQLEISR